MREKYYLHRDSNLPHSFEGSWQHPPQAQPMKAFTMCWQCQSVSLFSLSSLGSFLLVSFHFFFSRSFNLKRKKEVVSGSQKKSACDEFGRHWKFSEHVSPVSRNRYPGGAGGGCAGRGRAGQRWASVASGGILEGQFNTLKPKLFFFSTRSKNPISFFLSREKKNAEEFLVRRRKLTFQFFWRWGLRLKRSPSEFCRVWPSAWRCGGINRCFCCFSTSLPLSSPRWVRSTFSSLCALTSK